jgi:hypothetical protein
MVKNKFIKFFISSLLVIIALWVVIPKVSVNNLIQQDSSTIPVTVDGGVKSQSADEADFEKYNKPAYFNIFKFICSFIPSQKR